MLAVNCPCSIQLTMMAAICHGGMFGGSLSIVGTIVLTTLHLYQVATTNAQQLSNIYLLTALSLSLACLLG